MSSIQDGDSEALRELSHQVGVATHCVLSRVAFVVETLGELRQYLINDTEVRIRHLEEPEVLTPLVTVKTPGLELFWTTQVPFRPPSECGELKEPVLLRYDLQAVNKLTGEATYRVELA